VAREFGALSNCRPDKLSAQIRKMSLRERGIACCANFVNETYVLLTECEESTPFPAGMDKAAATEDFKVRGPSAEYFGRTGSNFACVTSKR